MTTQAAAPSCDTCEHWTREPAEIASQPVDTYPWGKCRDPEAPFARFDVFNWRRTHEHHSCGSWLAIKGQMAGVA